MQQNAFSRIPTRKLKSISDILGSCRDKYSTHESEKCHFVKINLMLHNLKFYAESLDEYLKSGRLEAIFITCTNHDYPNKLIEACSQIMQSHTIS